MGGSAAETIRQPRDRLTGQPQERQHSAAVFRRDAGPTAPGEGFISSCARDRHRMAETRASRLRDLRRPGERQRVEPDR